MKGVYQHCSEKHLHRYLSEFDFRYSYRVRLGYTDAMRGPIDPDAPTRMPFLETGAPVAASLADVDAPIVFIIDSDPFVRQSLAESSRSFGWTLRAFARVREFGHDKSVDHRPAGLVAFLSLSPEEQQARYRAGVERAVNEDPRNLEAQVEYLKLLLRERKAAQAPAKVAKPAARQEVDDRATRYGRQALHITGDVSSRHKKKSKSRDGRRRSVGRSWCRGRGRRCGRRRIVVVAAIPSEYPKYSSFLELFLLL